MLTSRVKVLHVVHWSDGGLSKIAQYLAVPKERNDAKIVILEDNGGTVDSTLDCHILRSTNPLSRLFRLWIIIHQFRPDVVHVHSFSPLIFAAVLLPPRSRLVLLIFESSRGHNGNDPWASSRIS